MGLDVVLDVFFKVVVNENEYWNFIFHNFEDAKHFAHAYYYDREDVNRIDIDVILNRIGTRYDVIESFYYTREDFEKDVHEAEERIKSLRTNNIKEG